MQDGDYPDECIMHFLEIVWRAADLDEGDGNNAEDEASSGL